MPDAATYQAMLTALTDDIPAAVASVNADGQIIYYHSAGGPAKSLACRGKPAEKVLRRIFGPSIQPVIDALAACRFSGEEIRVRRFRHETVRGLTEFFDWRFIAAPDWSGVILYVQNVTESVYLEQEFSSISQRNEATNRDLYSAMSALDFRLMELDQAHRKLGALYRITSVVQRTVNEQEVLQEIIDGITSDLGYSNAAVLLLDEPSLELVIKANHGYTFNMRIPYGKGITWQAVISRKVVYVPDVRKDPRYIAATVDGVSEIAIPLIYADNVIGVLDVETTEERPLSDYDRDLLCSLAGQAALTIAHAKHVSAVQVQAITDGLTGLYNYRYFLSALDREFKRAIRYNRPLSLLMMDIDFFKRYNDTHGHSLGNDVLREIADIMKRMCRDVDYAIRYGGEEFTILFPETGVIEANAVAERIRAVIADYPFHGRQTQPGGMITVSIGIAAYPNDATSGKELLEHADTALYLAKRTTKNCVMQYPAAPFSDR